MEKLNHFLNPFFYFLFILLACTQAPKDVKAQYSDADNYYLELSASFLADLKDGKTVGHYPEKFAKIDHDSLHRSLKSPNQKKAFWINVYNAYIQYTLKRDPTAYEDRSAFFSKDQINIGGEIISFDDIEHGLLRNSTWKLSLGYVKNPFAPEFESKFRLVNLDERIHFALNCGAESCPPVAIYSAINFDRQIDAIAKSFLQEVSTYNAAENEVSTTTLFSWFRGDFGGSSGIRKTLIRYEVLPKGSDAEINFQEYDWTMKLDHYYAN